MKEDCEAMPVPMLAGRIAAVSAGSDRVAKILHARYGRRRLEALDAESNRIASEGCPAGAGVLGERRALGEAVSGLEEQLKDPKAAERERALKEAATESKKVAHSARSRLSEADGTAERAQLEHAEKMRAIF